MKLPSDFNSAQEIFDYVVKKVIEQGKPSMDKQGQCRHRGPDGTCCAAGFLIPDGHPAIPLRGTWCSTVLWHEDLRSDHDNLIFELQEAHDNAATDVSRNHTVSLVNENFVQHFKRNAKIVAHRYSLDFNH